MAVREVFPRVERRECFRHLMQNYMKQFSGKEYMYPAAQAYRREVYEHHILNVSFIGGVTVWLKEYHSLLWYRSGFNPAIKCDYITKNIVEVFDNWIKDYKDLPVCQLADKIREMVIELFFRRRIGERLHGKILPSVISILNARTKGLVHLSLVKGDHYSVEVQDNNNVFTKHDVKAHQKYCSCLEWQHTGKPCQHALIVIIAQQFRDVGIKNFVDDYFSVKKFKKAYGRVVEELGDRSL
jgi:hypothetical protein